MLESHIREKRQEKEILLMTHIVMGYPSFEASMEIVEHMVTAGVDLIELQIPFSEPIADGPVILKANQKALENGSTTEKCIEFAREAVQRFDIPFLFMSYANILYKRGVTAFVETMADIGISGAIVPDLPPEEGGSYMQAMETHDLSPIYIFSPETSDSRMAYLSGHARGFIYCVARRGVTGRETAFSDDLAVYLKRCRNAANLPTAVGFGVKNRSDIRFLEGKADIAVIGSETIRVVERSGAQAAGDFIKSVI